MRTAATEYLSQTQTMSRLGATFAALVHEQVAAVRRFLDEGSHEEASDLHSIAELSVRVVERSAEWLEVPELVSLVGELREALSQIVHLRAEQREELAAQCRVSLDSEERLAERLRADGFVALLERGAAVSDTLDRLREDRRQARAQELSSARGMIDEETPDLGNQENLLALTFEIKNSLVHQNERISSMGEVVSGALEAAQAVFGEWESLQKGAERRRISSGKRAESGQDLLGSKALSIHQKLHDTLAGLHTLSHELNQLLGLQYALERRARDLDEHLLWEFLDPLDRHVDDMYSAVQGGTAGRKVSLSIQTGGVGFEPEIGGILLPLILELLESVTPLEESQQLFELQITAAREGLEARFQLEGPIGFDPGVIAKIEAAMEDLGGFVLLSRRPAAATLQLQFPMARSLRSFLIVEAGGQRIALPWSAIERIVASREDPGWATAHGESPVYSLASLFGHEEEKVPAPDPRAAGETLPMAVLRCGSGSAVVRFDRLVWRENAKLKPMPRRLYPVEEVLGGIVSPDSGITLVLNPSGLLKRTRAVEPSPSGGNA